MQSDEFEPEDEGGADEEGGEERGDGEEEAVADQGDRVRISAFQPLVESSKDQTLFQRPLGPIECGKTEVINSKRCLTVK